ncbi:hypothetical protein DBR11_03440 [Pedobacter sp. HMWF019]|uniref:hypothetical protein n=1 Tax=Pedobacter sp. HMWF019 TaxID=2056856 RepID=UPI000D33C425|nr:hypothetical protein [Pedobacter sp. HMWF019]PTT03030.1 hypothetical protein DBR11_03440 [Pedobacter sp. HMWF019]
MSDAAWPALEETSQIIKMYPIEKYKMAFFGDGVIVALIRTDNEFMGNRLLLVKQRSGSRSFRSIFIGPLPMLLWKLFASLVSKNS